MSKPGITSKGGLPWKKYAGLGAVGAAVVGTALALSQCSDDEQTPAPQPTETPAAPPADSASGWNPDAWIFRYEAGENMPIRESAAAGAKEVIFLKKGSCVESRPGADGNANRANGFAEVRAESANGINASEGWMELKNLSNHGSYKIGGTRPAETCTAEFISAVTDAEQRTVPAQFLSVSGNAIFYNTANETSAPAGNAGDGSCVKDTGIHRGNMMQVQVNGDKTYWAVTENFRAAPTHITAATCQAKFTPSF